MSKRTDKLRDVTRFVQSYLKSPAGKRAEKKGTAMYHAFVGAVQ